MKSRFLHRDMMRLIRCPDLVPDHLADEKIAGEVHISSEIEPKENVLRMSSSYLIITFFLF